MGLLDWSASMVTSRPAATAEGDPWAASARPKRGEGARYRVPVHRQPPRPIGGAPYPQVGADHEPAGQRRARSRFLVGAANHRAEPPDARELGRLHAALLGEPAWRTPLARGRAHAGARDRW